jgi:hypothetical protein
MSFRDEPLSKTSLRRALLPAALAASLVACSESPPPPSSGLGPRPPMPEIAAQTGAQRLTVAQYGNAIRDLFGEDISVPTSLEPDAPLDGFVTLGSSVSTISSRGVEKYEKAAFAIAQQVVADPARKAAVLPCAPAGPSDLECAKKLASSLGRRVYRRPLAAA